MCLWYWHLTVILHYNDVIMGSMASQITSLTFLYSAVYSGADQRKHQSSASLAFVGPMNSPHKWTVTRKMLLFDDVIMRDTKLKMICYLWLYTSNSQHENLWIYLNSLSQSVACSDSKSLLGDESRLSLFFVAMLGRIIVHCWQWWRPSKQWKLASIPECKLGECNATRTTVTFDVFNSAYRPIWLYIIVNVDSNINLALYMWFWCRVCVLR